MGQDLYIKYTNCAEASNSISVKYFLEDVVPLLYFFSKLINTALLAAFT